MICQKCGGLMFWNGDLKCWICDTCWDEIDENNNYKKLFDNKINKILLGTTSTQTADINNTSCFLFDDIIKLMKEYDLDKPRLSKIEANYGTILKFERMIKTAEQNKITLEFGILEYERICGIPVWENDKIINNHLNCYDQYDKLMYAIVLLNDQIFIVDIKILNKYNYSEWDFNRKENKND